MKRILASVACAIALSLCLGGLIGCGGSSGSTTPPPPPAASITSFAAAPATITVGASSSLTGVFSGGTGVITPGNLAVSSGVAVAVNPIVNTTYTLTVTPTSGSAVTQTTTVTVNPAPTISSFVAAPQTITEGGSSSLTAVFANGTGVITPGSIAVTSGVAVSVSPTATTTYTLTVTPTAGGTAITQTATVTVNPVATMPTITSFVASASTITAGGSDNLTAVFAGGTGVITPGNLAVTSGAAVSVSPTTTTTYTLTVTPPAGAAITATVNVTVDPAPTITSFVANPTSVGPGGSTNLTAVFANGTGVITPGNLPIFSGTPLSVSPTATTTYTLTVTNPIGTPTTAMTTVTYNAGAAAISSFTANPTTIAAGSSSSLTADFTNGTGVITPGNIAVTSGTPVSVSPAATTTYTLTVTPASGTAVTGMATVTVDPAPIITSFGASPATIATGTSSSLTAVFSNGTGVITPGNIAVTSGTAVSVSPTTTTIYTLTVTPPLGTAITQTTTVSIQSSVTVNPSNTGAAISNQIIGMNMAVWDDFTNGGSYTASSSPILTAFQNAGVASLRWPGGSTSDVYHWNGTSTSNPANGVAPTPSTCDSAYQNSNTNYLNFINDLELPNPALAGLPNGFDVALTADYGTSPNCIGGGVPSEAANWVTYAYANGGTVSHVTVGNEEYGSWETDNHTPAHSGATYAAAVAGTSGYYALIKAASSSTLVGVIVEPNYAPWDADVLSGAPYDFVEYHFYPQNPGGENDTSLVHTYAQEFTTNINAIKIGAGDGRKTEHAHLCGRDGLGIFQSGKTELVDYAGLVCRPDAGRNDERWSIARDLVDWFWQLQWNGREQ